MKTQMLVIADAANIDSASGKINILGAFTRIYAKDFPVVHHRLFVVIRIVADSITESIEARSLEIKLIDSDDSDTILAMMGGPITLPREPDGSRPDVNIVLELNSIEFPHPGYYTFAVEVDSEEIGDTTIQLIKVE